MTLKIDQSESQCKGGFRGFFFKRENSKSFRRKPDVLRRSNIGAGVSNTYYEFWNFNLQGILNPTHPDWIRYCIHIKTFSVVWESFPLLLYVGEPIQPTKVDDVTMLFSDIVGFTAICATCTPMMVVSMLNSLYTQFDHYCGMLDVYKVLAQGWVILYYLEEHEISEAKLKKKLNIAICHVKTEEHLLPKFYRNNVYLTEEDDRNLVSVRLIKFIFSERLH